MWSKIIWWGDKIQVLNYSLLPNKSCQLPKDKLLPETLMNFSVSKIAVVLRRAGREKHSEKPFALVIFFKTIYFRSN